MTVRNKGLSDQQTLVWDDENWLSQVQDNNGNLLEQYWYDADGARVKKVGGGTTTYTFFGHYEEEVTGAVMTTVSHYCFGGLRIAVKRGSDLYHLHGDHLGSTSLTTDGAGAATASRAYYAYGAMRSSSGTLQTDRTFTGQKADASGLMYYKARYYDPTLGLFISPDSLVPDPSRVIDYNRLLYVRGNPLKYKDPSGQCPRPRGQYATLNIICVAAFIPTKASRAYPENPILDDVFFEGDNRGFSSDSPEGSSRMWVWIDADTGTLIGKYVHGTQEVTWPDMEPIGQEFPALNERREGFRGIYSNISKGTNSIESSISEDGSIHLSYRVVCSHDLCNRLFAPNGVVTFVPNEYGSYDANGNVNLFPNLEAYHMPANNKSRTLFQIENYSEEERAIGLGAGVTMFGMAISRTFSATQEAKGEDNTSNRYFPEIPETWIWPYPR